MITGKATGFKEGGKLLQEIRKELRGESGKLYQDLGQHVHDSIDRNFSAEGRPAWRPRVTGGDWPILDKTGQMKDSAEQSALRPWRHRDAIHDLDIHTPHYGEYHQHTGILTRGRRVIREFVKFLPNELTGMDNRILEVFDD